MSNYSEEMIKGMLRKHICEIVFTKRDGSERKMICTANWEWLNRDDVAQFIGFYPPSGKNPKQWKPGQICVFDLDNEDWRSFYVEKVKSIKIKQRLDEQF